MVTGAKKHLQIPLDVKDLERFTAAAGARNMSNSQFLLALLSFHDLVRALAARVPTGSEMPSVTGALEDLGLQTVAR